MTKDNIMEDIFGEHVEELGETKTPSLYDVRNFSLPEHNWEKHYHLKEGDIYVEVGAFWGRYGLRAINSKCSKVILIEPSPENITTIKNLLNIIELKNQF